MTRSACRPPPLTSPALPTRTSCPCPWTGRRTPRRCVPRSRSRWGARPSARRSPSPRAPPLRRRRRRTPSPAASAGVLSSSSAIGAGTKICTATSPTRRASGASVTGCCRSSRSSATSSSSSMLGIRSTRRVSRARTIPSGTRSGGTCTPLSSAAFPGTASTATTTTTTTRALAPRIRTSARRSTTRSRIWTTSTCPVTTM
mmetsp:Transcript_94169/g.303051  ORF Transcript_94169/g.303051 Transcript_94169/m.303051 type:complete len:201 (-) Transcript_94169:672-1274(-)